MLPRLAVRHTSREEGGQIYVPVMNWILFAGVLLLTAAFRSSSRLAAAYGLAVTGTLLLTSALFLLLARHVWRVQTWKLVVYLVLVVGVELTFLGANLTKVVAGGWLPLVIAALVVALMTTWRRGADALHAEARDLEGPLAALSQDASRNTPTSSDACPASPSSPTPTPRRRRSRCAPTPTSTASCTTESSSCRSSTRTCRTSGTSTASRSTTSATRPTASCTSRCTSGFTDSQDIPRGLALAVGKTPELDIDLDEARYFLSVLTVQATGHRGLRTWRKRLFAWMYHNAANRTEVFHLPPERTIVMGAHVEL